MPVFDGTSANDPDGSRIVMDAPPDLEPCTPFIQLAEKLSQAGIIQKSIIRIVNLASLSSLILVILTTRMLYREQRNELCQLGSNSKIIKMQRGI